MFPLCLTYCTQMHPASPGGGQAIMATKTAATLSYLCDSCLTKATQSHLTAANPKNTCCTSQKDLAAGQRAGQRMQVISVPGVLSLENKNNNTDLPTVEISC